MPGEPIGVTVDLRVCGMVTVGSGDDTVASPDITGFIVRDRVGLRRDLVALTTT